MADEHVHISLERYTDFLAATGKLQRMEMENRDQNELWVAVLLDVIRVMVSGIQSATLGILAREKDGAVKLLEEYNRHPMGKYSVEMHQGSGKIHIIKKVAKHDY